MIQQSIVKGEKQPDLPEMIGGHPWFMYVDPGVDAKSMEYVSQTIDAEFKFMLKIMGLEEEVDDAKEVKDSNLNQNDAPINSQKAEECMKTGASEPAYYDNAMQSEMTHIPQY